MTEPPEETPAATPAAAPEPEKKEPAKKEGGFPVGQAAVGGAGAVVIGTAALVSAVGPIGWLAAPAAATAAGGAYVAYRRRKRDGGQERIVKTTTTKSSGSRTSGGLLGGGRSGAGSSGRTSGTATSAKRSGGLSASGRTSGGGSAAGRGGTPAPTPRGSAARPGSSPRPGGGSGGPSAAGRRTGGGTAPRTGSGGRRTSGADTGSSRRSGGRTSTSRPSGGMPDRSGDTTTAKRKTAPTSRAGGGTTGGPMARNRWGGASGPTSGSTRGGRIKRGAAKARDWADDKTGRKASAGWAAARGQAGFANRRRAAGQAVKDAGGGGFLAGLVGLLAALFSRGRTDKEGADTPTADTGAGPRGGRVFADMPADPNDPRAGRYRPTNPPPGLYPVSVENPTGLGWGPSPPDDDTPTAAATTAPTTGGTTMSGLPAAATATDMAAVMARYAPEDAWSVVAESKQWPTVSAQVAMSVKNYADQLEAERFPLNEAVIEKLHEYAQALASTRSIAEEIEPLIRKAHQADLDKQDAPRGNERLWNVR